MSASLATVLAPCNWSDRTWTRRDAAHLLWRTQHGASYADQQRAADEGCEATLERLLAPQPETAEFESADAALRRLATDSGNIDDLKAWWAHRLLYSANPLLEKLTLFWHNHFATSNAKVRSAAQMAAQNETLRRHALGNFRELLSAMARDVAMLVWLDGNANRARQPNENFAREVMELFSLGVGNYSEKDIQEAARAFTGWHVRDGKYWLNRRQHDPGVKSVLGRNGKLDGDDVIAVCLEQEACPRFLAKKLLQSFVMPAPPPEAVDAVSDSLRRHDYALQPTLRELFSSELFFQPAAYRSVIKGPSDLVLGALRSLDGRARLRAAVQRMADLGQNLFEPPTVKGWEGGRLWINSTTMLQRANFAAALAMGDSYGAIADPATLAEQHGWREPNAMIEHYTELLLAKEPASVSATLRRALAETSGNLSRRLRGVIHLILALPEYQLM